MKSGSWDNTVTIELGGRRKTYARISTTRGAASYLIDQWPGSRDNAYKQAIVSCTKALKGEVNDEAAFTSFVRAALVSGLKYTSAPYHTPNEFEREIARALTQSLLNDLHPATR
ncbi:DUF982 domain-containing protein [Agrobacterium sp. LC34]|uniref:DUF982 domain-containing protein n=1 Tax=Agrobacterium sp. LC34 TaxID=1643810 RepID=UPI000B312E87|nr:DUF982 domain-containing protein [Agrobacterium sp. LC34]